MVDDNYDNHDDDDDDDDHDDMNTNSDDQVRILLHIVSEHTSEENNFIQVTCSSTLRD